MALDGYAPSLPLNLDADGGYVLIQNLKQLARQNIKMIVLTDPGERIMDPNFGAGVRGFLFENETNNAVVQSQVKNRIKSQVSKYLPWVVIAEVQTFFDEVTYLLSVKIFFYIPYLGNNAESIIIEIR